MKITHNTISECIADNACLTKKIIRFYPIYKKRGLKDYWIERFKWYGELRYIVVIDSSWNFFGPCTTFYNLREAFNYMIQKVRKKT